MTEELETPTEVLFVGGVYEGKRLEVKRLLPYLNVAEYSPAYSTLIEEMEEAYTTTFQVDTYRLTPLITYQEIGGRVVKYIYLHVTLTVEDLMEQLLGRYE